MGSAAMRSVLAAVLLILLPGCYALLPPEGGGSAEFQPPRRVDASDVLLPPGYRIEAIASGLTFPSGIAFDARGRPHVIEAGFSYGPVYTTARLLRLEPGGGTTVVATGDTVPWTGVTFHRNAFYIASGGQTPGQPMTGRILRITPDGRASTVLDGLPGHGDHHTNGPVIGPDGWLYFAQGTATNSGVVGIDNYEFGWLRLRPDYHDIPCRDIRLTGVNFTTPNPFRPAVREPFRDDPETVVTGAFKPFGVPSRAGEVVPGRMPCVGAIMRVRPEGGAPQLVAWGFRNPFGLAFAPDGSLYATENAYDIRGSRPVFGAGDPMWRVEPSRWYGWPDFHAGQPLYEGDRYAEPSGVSRPRRLLAEHSGTPPRPAALFGVHASANGLDFARDTRFAAPGIAFVAQFGDQVPLVGKTLAPVGFKVVTVDPRTGVILDFATNRGPVHGPASWAGHGGLERPVDVAFAPSGTALYVVDFGVMTMSESAGAQPYPGTGVVWRITREPALAAGGG